jgi:GGDEF domain-containing protein
MAVVASAGEWPSRKVHQGGRPAKYVVSAGALALACVAAAQVRAFVPGPLGVVLALPTFCLLNPAFVAALYCFEGKPQLLRKFLDPYAHLVEVSTQALGAGVGLAMLYWHPLLAIGALVLPLGLHLVSLRHVVEAENAFDPETGLWSEIAWRVQAQQRLHDTRGHVALFIIDPDRAGQERQILRSIESGLAPSDLLGRYGTRQLVVLIPVGRPEAGSYLSAGFRADLAADGIQAALSCATTADSDLEGLLIEAMSDLMRRRAAAGVTRSW